MSEQINVNEQIKTIHSEIQMLDGFHGRAKGMAAASISMRCGILGQAISECEPEIPADLLEHMTQEQRRVMLASYLHVVAITLVSP